MKHFLITLVRSGAVFGFFMFLYFLAVYGPGYAAISGALTSGVLFGFAMAAVGAYHARSFRLNRPDLGPEKLLKEGPSNHFYKGIAVGGWIYLTATRLIFNSHSMNFEKHAFEIPLADISEVETARSLLGLKNKLHLHYGNGRIESFVVDDLTEWKQLIETELGIQPVSFSPPQGEM